MYNEILKIGPVTLHGYGLMIGLGFIAALLIGAFRARKRGMDDNVVYMIGIFAIVFGLLGAKLLYCIIEFKALMDSPWDVIASEGFVLYGGLIGGIAAVMLYCRKKKVSFLAYFDLLAPSIAIGQAFGRIGCFLAGCCYGQETHGPFGMDYWHNGESLIPTQLLSSAGDFIIAGALILLARRDRRRGLIGSLYLILYSAGRFVIEFFRGDERGSVGALSTSQFISIFILIAGVALLLLSRRKGAEETAGEDKPESDGEQEPDEETEDEGEGAEAAAPERPREEDGEEPPAGGEETGA